jgi:D-tyrosyl-tRNA(Tyr) deacylase
MRAVVQRVTHASVEVDGETVGAIDDGMLALVGVAGDDDERDAAELAHKLVHLRIFEDEAGRMNRSLLEVGGELCVVSQFTLFGDCRKGRRPYFGEAAPPDLAEPLVNKVVASARALGVPTETGRFQAMMNVSLLNRGPVTLLLDTKKAF